MDQPEPLHTLHPWVASCWPSREKINDYGCGKALKFQCNYPFLKDISLYSMDRLPTNQNEIVAVWRKKSVA